MHHPFPLEHLALTRRELLARCGMGLGTLALGGMLNPQQAAANGGIGVSPPMPHFPAKAKHVIHLFMNGGPSHVDTFDPKPSLAKYAGQKLPMEYLATERPTGAAFPSPFKFRKYGQSGIEVSDLFANVASVLPVGGRFYLQTMVFGPNMIPLADVDIDAPRESDAWYLALLGRQFPGSWLPLGLEQIVRCAEPHFRLVSSSSGRLDYIETIRQWRQRFGAPSMQKTLLKLRLAPRWLTSADFRLAFTSGVSANSVCFERELLEHHRLVLEKR